MQHSFLWTHFAHLLQTLPGIKPQIVPFSPQLLDTTCCLMGLILHLGQETTDACLVAPQTLQDAPSTKDFPANTGFPEIGLSLECISHRYLEP